MTDNGKWECRTPQGSIEGLNKEYLHRINMGNNCLMYAKSMEDFDNLIANISNKAVKEFAEKVKAEIKEALTNNYRARNERMSKTDDEEDWVISYCQGKIDCLRGLDDFIDNLKKETVGDAEP